MARWLDEEKATVYSSVLDIPFALSGEFFSKVGRMLILDVLDDRVPTVMKLASTSWQSQRSLCVPSVIVHLIAIAWSVYDAKPQADSILLNDYRKDKRVIRSFQTRAVYHARLDGSP